MKREILFRGKEKDTGEWVYGDLSFHTDGTPFSVFIWTWKETGSSMYYRPIEVDEDTVGQYTGVTNSDGQKIFEGDIVEVSLWPDTYCLGRVEWRQKDCCFCVRLSKYKSAGLYPSAMLVGNINDNPELVRLEE